MSKKTVYYYVSDNRGHSPSKEYVFMNQEEAKELGVLLFSEPKVFNPQTILDIKAQGYNVVLVAWSNGNSTSMAELVKQENKAALLGLSGWINIRGRITDNLFKWGLAHYHPQLVTIYNFNKRDNLGYTVGNELEVYYLSYNRFLSNRVHYLEDNVPHTGRSPHKRLVELMEKEIAIEVPTEFC